MFIEGKEALKKRKIDQKELLLLSTPDDIENTERTLILLQKQNNDQIKAALSIANLTSIVKSDPVNFGKKIIPAIYLKIQHVKNEQTLDQIACDIELMADQ